jgi:hypothetical protein
MQGVYSVNSDFLNKKAGGTKMLLKNIKEQGARCEVGVCGELADYSLTDEGVTAENELHICKSCLKKLARLVAEEENGDAEEDGKTAQANLPSVADRGQRGTGTSGAADAIRTDISNVTDRRQCGACTKIAGQNKTSRGSLSDQFPSAEGRHRDGPATRIDNPSISSGNLSDESPSRKGCAKGGVIALNGSGGITEKDGDGKSKNRKKRRKGISRAPNR